MDKDYQEPAKILTEETIQKFDEHNKQHANSYAVDVLIKSHRLLFSANAELSFSNMLLKAAYNKLLKENNSCSTQ